jgi:hypothetical protein
MTHRLLRSAIFSIAVGLTATGAALADCESDLFQLEDAYKTPNLTAAAKAALDDAKTKAVAALKKDDDATCHKAVKEGFTNAGLPMK